MKKQSGAVLIFSLMILSIIIILTEQLIRSVMVGSNFNQTMITREHAEMFALGGINLAIAQLTLKSNSDEKSVNKTEQQLSKSIDSGAERGVSDSQSKDKNTNDKDTMKNFVLNLISNLNRFQVFDFYSKIDNVSGQLKICISSEHGKININEAFDFKHQDFKKEFKQLLAGLEVPGKIPAGEFNKRITEFLKKRKKKLCDVTELIDVPGFEKLDAFYMPPGFDIKGNGQQNTDLALQDIFTIWSDDGKIDPLLLSDSLCAILNIRRPRADDAKKQKGRFDKVMEEFQKDWGRDWESNWKHLQNIYDNRPKVLSNIKDILVENFEPKVYSILSCAKIENVEQRLLAVIKQVEEKQNDQIKDNNKEDEVKLNGDNKKPSEHLESSSDNKKEGKNSRKFFKIIRLYWL